MTSVAIDTGVFVALFNGDDKDHKRSVNFIRENKRPLFTSLACVTETSYLLNFSQNAQIDFISWIPNSGIAIEPISAVDLIGISSMMDKYKSLPMDFADASLVFLLNINNSDLVATFDGDFTIYKTSRGKEFKILT